jgi:arylsulfatase A-like enzyme
VLKTGRQLKKPFCKMILALLCPVFIFGCSEQRPESSLAGQLPVDEHLNVLIVSFDALRADALGLYGYQRPTSPNLDEFAQQALVFEQALTAAPVTPTSFAAAFTGQLPFRVFYKWNLIDTVTIATVFAEAGRNTFGLFNNTQLVAERNFQQGFQQYDVVHLPDEEVLNLAIQRLEQHADEPFFGWVHFISPHSPYSYRELASQFYDPDYQGRFEKTTPGEFELENDAELARVRNLYDGEIFFADQLFGQLMAKLESLGLKENTLVVVTADHGEEFMDHGQLQHNAQYQELIRIPLIIFHPGVSQGARTDAPYLNVDLLPTLASIAGIRYPEVADGIDLTRAYRSDRVLVSTGMTHRDLRQMSINKGQDKLIVTCQPDYLEQLYALTGDPREKQDRILDQPELAGVLFSDLETTALGDPCVAITKAISGQQPETGLSDEQLERLKSLGYIQ